MSDKEVGAKRFISEYRQDKYNLNEDGTWDKRNERIYQDLTNAVEQLSKGLYEKDVHFLLELIQNAEDNQYSECSPDLKFLLLQEDPTGTLGSDGCLCVFNNEVGFSTENIESISSIGRSTKKKVDGYIGEKGIGFKSVFIVSESPHIFSNGYQIKFLEKDPDFILKYIVPYWVDQVPTAVTEHPATTSLLLPLKQGKKQLIVDHLKDIQAETILFLRKLEGLTVDIEESKECIELARNKGRNGVTELLVQSGVADASVHNYWLFDMTIVVPRDLKEEKREGIKERSITIALPLDPGSRSGLVYSYLPTEVDSGFPFLINADFMLTANRESIQSERPWNVWLQSEISAVVVSALLKMRDDPKFAEDVYRYIPIPGQAKSLPKYFGAICKSILECLGKKDFVLSDRSTLISANKVRLCLSSYRNLVDTNERPDWFDDFSIVSPAIEKYREQLAAIGVKVLNISEVMEWLDDEDWLRSRNVEWFAELYAVLGATKAGNKRELGKKLIIPIEGGGLARAREIVFLPDDRKLFQDILFVLPMQLRESIRFVDKAFYELIAKKKDSLGWALEKLELSEFSLDGFLSQSLLPWLHKNYESIDVDSLMKLNKLILSNWYDINEVTKDKLGDLLPIILDSGEICGSSDLEGDELLVPRSLNPEQGWQILLASPEDCAEKDVLSDIYTTIRNKDNEEIFQDFLQALDAQEYPDFPKHVFRTGDKSNEYAWRVLSSFRKKSTGPISFHTWIAPVGLKNEKIFRSKKFRTALIGWLEFMIGPRLEEIRDGKLNWFYRDYRADIYESSLLNQLMHTPWLKTSKGYTRPVEVFLETKQAKELFGKRLAYLDGRMSKEVAELLGVKTDVSATSLIDLLKEYSEQSDFNDEGLVKKIYVYLDSLDSFDPEPFTNKPLIYVKGEGKHWRTVPEVIWEDSAVALGDAWGWLSTQYDTKLKGFFVDKLGVTEDVDDEAIASAWTRYQDSKRSEEAVEKFLELAMPRLARCLSDDATLEWQKGFFNSALVWTQDKDWQDPESVYIADDRRLSSLFRDQVHLVWKPESRTHTSLESLYNELGVSKLSESVTYFLDDNCNGEMRDENVQLTDRSIWLICYAICNIGKDGDELFDRLLSGGIIARLVSSREIFVTELVVNAEIENSFVEAELDNLSVFLDIESSSLYIDDQADDEDVKDDLAESLARIIWGSQRFKENVSKIQVLLSISKEERFKKLRDRDEWHLSLERQSELRDLFSRRGGEQEVNAGDTFDGCNNAVFLDSNESNLIEELVDGKNADDQDDDTLIQEEPDEFDNDEKLYENQVSKPAINSNTPGHPVNPNATPEQLASRRQGSRAPGTGGYSRPRQTGTSLARTPHGHKDGCPNQRPSTRLGRPKSAGIAASINQARRNQMRSYVASDLVDSENSDNAVEVQKARAALGEQAEIEVLQDLQSKGYEAKRMSANNKGYDIEAINRTTSEIIYLEVKGDSYDWSDKGVGITYSQYDMAKRKGNSFFLAVVENLRSHPRKIFYIQDPVAYITEYRFDAGWASLATEIGEVSTDLNESVADKLKALTDLDNCKIIIEYCAVNGYPFPDVGVEIQNADGLVIFEGVELAWEQEKFGVLPSEELRESVESLVDDWYFLLADDLHDIQGQLERLFNADSKCET